MYREWGRGIGRLSRSSGNNAPIEVERDRLTGRCLCVAAIRVISGIVRVDGTGGALFGWNSIKERSVGELRVEELFRWWRAWRGGW
jgi:hypothetical protein